MLLKESNVLVLRFPHVSSRLPIFPDVQSDPDDDNLKVWGVLAFNIQHEMLQDTM